MRVFLFFILFQLVLTGCKTSLELLPTSDPNKIAVKSNRFHGTAFSQQYESVGFSYINGQLGTRFTPTKEDIQLAEQLLKQQLATVNKGHVNQFKRKEYLERNLHKYFRQYVGYITKSGKRTLYINFSWNRFTLIDRLSGYWDSRLKYSSDFQVVSDGGSHYWSAEIDLSNKQVLGVSVNGVA